MHLLLKEGAFYPHTALAIAAHMEQPLGCQVSCYSMCCCRWCCYCCICCCCWFLRLAEEFPMCCCCCCSCVGCCSVKAEQAAATARATAAGLFVCIAIAAFAAVAAAVQLLYADALQASALPQPPREVRRVYRLLGGAPPPAAAVSGAAPAASAGGRPHGPAVNKLRCSQVETQDGVGREPATAPSAAAAAEATEAAAVAGGQGPRVADAASAAACAALWAADAPFLDWRAELAAALLFEQETGVLVSPVLLREELRPPPQAPDAPRDLKRVR